MAPTPEEVGSSTIGSDVRSPLDQAQARPTTSDMIRAIRAELRAQGLDCTRDEAYQFLHTLRQAIRKARQSEYRSCRHVLTAWQMKTVHRIIDIVMPDDTVPVPGSAHELLQRGHLQGRELAIVHTKNDRDACVLDLRLEVVG